MCLANQGSTTSYKHGNKSTRGLETKVVAMIKAIPRNVKPQRESISVPSMAPRPKCNVPARESFQVSSGRRVLAPRFSKMGLPSDLSHNSQAASYVSVFHTLLEDGASERIPTRASQQQGFTTPAIMMGSACRTPSAPKMEHAFQEDDFVMPDHLMLPVL
uniref:Uncharacterized protein n=1 Tax=Amphora coffeiformis TaxID=265554 RepID=A0A7S3LFK7_9STRA|mmetsp:Transcript_2458/g.5214  ORF Transcript_2458/g.5214 Transcript_2458/m.5214 type:complete len:160 (-) Transcript_2458:89-568(-)